MTQTAVVSRLVIPLENMVFTTGTWAFTEGSGDFYMLKTAADSTTTLTYSLPLPRRSGEIGVKPRAIINRVRITGANLDNAPTSTLYRVDLDAVNAGATGNSTITTVTTAFDGVVTLDAEDRLWTTTVSAPDWDYATEAECYYNHRLTLDGGASTVIRVYPAIVVYEEVL